MEGEREAAAHADTQATAYVHTGIHDDQPEAVFHTHTQAQALAQVYAGNRGREIERQGHRRLAARTQTVCAIHRQ